jgi:AcrR family transcriptional regulator
VNTVHTNSFTKGLPLGVKERQEREREAVSRSILDAARDLFVAEGYQNVSIRKIADRIEYSPAAIYSYFPSKDDIFFALAEEGFHLLLGTECPEGEPPLEELDDPIDALRAAFWHFYQFSRRHPEYFALMFVDRSVPRISHLWERFAFISSMKARLTGLIQKAADSGQLPKNVDPHVVFRILSTTMVGAAVTHLCNRLAPGEDAEALARDTLEASLTGLRTGFAFTFRTTACGEPSDLPSVARSAKEGRS